MSVVSARVPREMRNKTRLLGSENGQRVRPYFGRRLCTFYNVEVCRDRLMEVCEQMVMDESIWRGLSWWRGPRLAAQVVVVVFDEEVTRAQLRLPETLGRLRMAPLDCFAWVGLLVCHSYLLQPRARLFLPRSVVQLPGGWASLLAMRERENGPIHLKVYDKDVYPARAQLCYASRE